jgi:hypothetical protein
MHAQGREGDRRFNDLMVKVCLTSLHSLCSFEDFSQTVRNENKKRGIRNLDGGINQLRRIPNNERHNFFCPHSTWAD